MTATACQAPPLAVIPCGARKLREPARARELYTGPYFRAALAWAEDVTDGDPKRVLILSARYGFIRPWMVRAPYEQRMDRPGAISVERLRGQARWGYHLDDHPHVLAVGGAAYLDAVRAVWPHAVAPFEGLALGHQLAALRRATTAPAPESDPVPTLF
jgi:hypothetical protein